MQFLRVLFSTEVQFNCLWQVTGIIRGGDTTHSKCFELTRNAITQQLLQLFIPDIIPSTINYKFSHMGRCKDTTRSNLKGDCKVQHICFCTKSFIWCRNKVFNLFSIVKTQPSPVFGMVITWWHCALPEIPHLHYFALFFGLYTAWKAKWGISNFNRLLAYHIQHETWNLRYFF